MPVDQHQGKESPLVIGLLLYNGNAENMCSPDVSPEVPLAPPYMWPAKGMVTRGSDPGGMRVQATPPKSAS